MGEDGLQKRLHLEWSSFEFVLQASDFFFGFAALHLALKGDFGRDGFDGLGVTPVG
jgi:hypothetical protein